MKLEEMQFNASDVLIFNTTKQRLRDQALIPFIKSFSVDFKIICCGSVLSHTKVSTSHISLVKLLNILPNKMKKFLVLKGKHRFCLLKNLLSYKLFIQICIAVKMVSPFSEKKVDGNRIKRLYVIEKTSLAAVELIGNSTPQPLFISLAVVMCSVLQQRTLKESDLNLCYSCTSPFWNMFSKCINN